MSSFSLAPASSLDRFDDGHARLDLPLNYDDYFRLLANPNIFANATVVLDEDGERRFQLDPVFVKLIIEWGYALARKISAASFGGAFPRDHADPLTLRTGSLEALGIDYPPPLFQLFRRFESDGFPFSRPLSEVEYLCWIQVICDNANNCRDWIAGAQCRRFIFGRSSGWDFETATFQQLDPISLHTLIFSSRLSSRATPSVDRALIPHPVLGSEAENALIPRPSTPLLNTRPLPENSCRDIIPHPIYGPDAHNALVRYEGQPRDADVDSGVRASIGRSIERPRAPTPWSAYGSPIDYSDSEPASPLVGSSRISTTAAAASETTSSGASDSSETPSDYSEPMGYFTVYESDGHSDVGTDDSWEEVPTNEESEQDYAAFQAAIEKALYEARGTRYDPIDLTE